MASRNRSYIPLHDNGSDLDSSVGGMSSGEEEELDDILNDNSNDFIQ